MEGVRRGCKGANIFETLGIREPVRGRGRIDGECWARNNGNGRDTALWKGGAGGENHGGGSCAGSKVVLVEEEEGY